LELAITLTLLLSLTFGMVEFGYCFYCKNMMCGAAREGARAGIVSGSTAANVTTAASNALASTNWPSSSYSVATTDTSGNPIDVSAAAVGTQIKVTVSGTWGVLGQGFSPLQLIPKARTVSGSCVMRKEQ
jgi:Flp pilus assembly protein TadG